MNSFFLFINNVREAGESAKDEEMTYRYENVHYCVIVSIYLHTENDERVHWKLQKVAAVVTDYFDSSSFLPVFKLCANLFGNLLKKTNPLQLLRHFLLTTETEYKYEYIQHFC